MEDGLKEARCKPANANTAKEDAVCAEAQTAADALTWAQTVGADVSCTAEETSKTSAEALTPTASDSVQATTKPNAQNDKKKFSMKKFVKRYFIDAFSGMALGLFCTLIAGTIIGEVGVLIGNNAVGKIIQNIALAAKMIMGAGIGVGIAHSFQAKKLTSFTAAAAGMIGANITNVFALSGIAVLGASANPSITIGDPVAAYVAAVFCIEISNLVEGKTPVDIILVPLVGICVGSLAAMALGLPFGILFALLGKGIAVAIGWNAVLFGILVSAVMGLLLTLPTSSAAFGVMLFGGALISPELSHASALAAGAACAGCCAHMVGFAVASFRENKWGGLISQGVGTSMLQIPNLARNPKILLPAVAASIAAGPLSSAAFGLLCDKTGAGMGTAGFVGVIQTFSASMAAGMSWWYVLIGVLVCYILVPAVVAFAVSEGMRKIGWLHYGDMKLPK